MSDNRYSVKYYRISGSALFSLRISLGRPRAPVKLPHHGDGPTVAGYRLTTQEAPKDKAHGSERSYAH